MRHADIVDDMNAKVNHICKLMAEQMLRKIREVEPIPPFPYCRPVIRDKQQKMLAKAMEATRGQIRSAFGLAEDSIGE